MRLNGLIVTGALVLLAASVFAAPAASISNAAAVPRDYKLLATQKTSTMEKELNEAASDGYRFQGVMGGETGFGGKETVSIVARVVGGERYEYKLLATNKTSTMQKELAEAARGGFEYRGQTVFETMFGGRELVVIMERLKGQTEPRFEYKLLATTQTSTMQKELTQVADAGFVFCAVTVGKTMFGGKEVVVITERDLRW
jgi:hypothetical protein